MSRILIVIIAVLFIVCAPSQLIGQCDAEAIDSKVIDALYEKFEAMPDSALAIWLDEDYDQSRVGKKLDMWQAKIDRTRNWATHSTMQPCVRAAYIYWLDYYKSELDEARAELRTHKLKNEQAAYDRSLKELEKKKKSCPRVPLPPA